jgi:hypothetical protein
MFQWCYAHGTVALQWCYRSATVVLARCIYNDATTFLSVYSMVFSCTCKVCAVSTSTAHLCCYCAIIVLLRDGVCTRTVCMMLLLGFTCAAMLWCIAIETSLKHTYTHTHTHTHTHNSSESLCLLSFPQIISLISVNQFCMVCTADCNAIHAEL